MWAFGRLCSSEAGLLPGRAARDQFITEDQANASSSFCTAHHSRCLGCTEVDQFTWTGRSMTSQPVRSFHCFSGSLYQLLFGQFQPGIAGFFWGLPLEVCRPAGQSLAYLNYTCSSFRKDPRPAGQSPEAAFRAGASRLATSGIWNPQIASGNAAQDRTGIRRGQSASGDAPVASRQRRLELSQATVTADRAVPLAAAIRLVGFFRPPCAEITVIRRQQLAMLHRGDLFN